jgi:hypothetical protein
MMTPAFLSKEKMNFLQELTEPVFRYLNKGADYGDAQVGWLARSYLPQPDAPAVPALPPSALPLPGEAILVTVRIKDAPTNASAGRKILVTSGIPVRLFDNPVPCIGVILTANLENTGMLFYGNDLVRADVTTHSAVGQLLVNGQSTVLLPIDDLSKLWIDSTASGDGVSFVWFYKPFEDSK